MNPKKNPWVWPQVKQAFFFKLVLGKIDFIVVLLIFLRGVAGRGGGLSTYLSPIFALSHAALV
jgi:hypothetical protein